MQEQQLTVDYFGYGNDEHGIPDPWHRYWVVAGRGPAGLWVASIVSLTRGQSVLANGDYEHVAVKEGGVQTALEEAEKGLDGLHKGLQKRWGDREVERVP